MLQQAQTPPVPTVALTMNNQLREHARSAGADVYTGELGAVIEHHRTAA